jgi:hypothetical protein
MGLTFRTAMLSEAEEVWRVIHAAFTPYVRALGREWPVRGSAAFAEEWKRGEAELARGDVYVALAGERIEGQFDDWMRGPPELAADMMKPYDGKIEVWEVGNDVGNVRNNKPELLDRLALV